MFKCIPRNNVGTRCHSRSNTLGTRVMTIYIKHMVKYIPRHKMGTHCHSRSYALGTHVNIMLTLSRTCYNMILYIQTNGKMYPRGKIYTRAWGYKVKLLNTDLKRKMNLLGQVARILKSVPGGLGLQIQAFE